MIFGGHRDIFEVFEGKVILEDWESLAIVIPTYKEAENMEPLLSAIKSVQRVIGRVHVYIVDDSPDEPGDTLAKAREASNLFDLEVSGIRRERKLGLGTAYKVGFKLALDEGHSFIAQMDADLSHSPSELPSMLRMLVDYDYQVVTGSRYQIGGQTEGWGIGRRLLSRLANSYYRHYLGLTVLDATSGFKMYRQEALDNIEFESFKSNDFGFQLEMAQRCQRMGLRMREWPITFKDRTAGESKMSLRVMLDTVLRVRRL